MEAEELIQHQQQVCCTWGKFRELSGLLIGKNVSFEVKGKVCVTCVKNIMVYGSETLAR